MYSLASRVTRSLVVVRIMMRKTLPFVLIVGLLLVTLAPLSTPTFGEFDFLRYWASTLVLLGLLMRGYRV